MFEEWRAGRAVAGAPVTQEGLTEVLGFGQSALSQYLNGRIPLNPRTASKFAKLFGVEVAAFSPLAAQQIAALATPGSSTQSAPLALVPTVARAPHEAPSSDDDDPDGVRIPLLANSGSLGPGSDIEHDDVILGTLTVSPDWLTRRIRPSSPGALRFIHAYGDSMSPTLEDGDIALVDTGRIDPSGADGVYVLATNERIFIKRVTERFNGGHDVTSDNSTVKTVQELNGDRSIRVLGKVVWVWNGKKL